MGARGPRAKSALDRFFVKVETTADCWHWTGAKQAGGYGRFMVSSGPRVLILAHRYSYELAVGPIPEDMTLDHLCRNPSCVNPAHLEVVTRAENALRANRNVDKTHCDRGHEFTEANTYIAPSRSHVRACRECRAMHSATRYAARKAAA